MITYLKKQKTYYIHRCQIYSFRTIDNKMQILLTIFYKIYVENISSFGINITERLLFQFCYNVKSVYMLIF